LQVQWLITGSSCHENSNELAKQQIIVVGPMGNRSSGPCETASANGIIPLSADAQRQGTLTTVMDVTSFCRSELFNERWTTILVI